MVERLGRLSDLELWREIRASKIECAHCCRRACVSQPNASGLRLARRMFCGRLSRYNFFQMSQVLFFILACDGNVVNVGTAEVETAQDTINKTLEGLGGIPKPFSGSSEVRKIGILPQQRSVWARRWRGEMGETLKRAGDGVAGH